MKHNLLGRCENDFYGRLLVEHGVRNVSKRDGTVCWLHTAENGWSKLVWVTFTEYSPGVLRVRNDLDFNTPRKVWQFDRPAARNFELSMLYTEFNEKVADELYGFLIAIAKAPELADREQLGYDWPMFDWNQTYPHYAWTKDGLARVPRARS